MRTVWFYRTDDGLYRIHFKYDVLGREVALSLQSDHRKVELGTAFMVQCRFYSIGCTCLVARESKTNT
jgi:hypothetical protein